MYMDFFRRGICSFTLLQRDKLLIGLQTDSRAAFLGAKLNVMIHTPLDYVAKNESDLIAAVEEYRGVVI